MRVGLVGLGRMGRAVLPHLVRGCSSVTVWNRSGEQAVSAAAAGALAARSLEEVVSASEIILSILLDDRAVEDVYLGPGGLLAAECQGRVFVEMSTIGPDTVRKVAAMSAKRGAAIIDAPVSGSVGPAREGKLLCLVGGAAADLDRVRPVLSLFSRRIEHLGPIGSGMSMKIALQLPIYVYWLALAEALSIGQRSGLDPRIMLDLIADSPAALAALRPKIPAILREDNSVAFALAAAHKDLTLIRSVAAKLGVTQRATDAALQSYGDAVQAGLAEEDAVRLASFIMGRAGDQIAASNAENRE